MTKKAKAKLEQDLLQHVNKKYPQTISQVKVIDKNNCVITVEVEWNKRYIDISLPIAALGYQVQGS